MCESFVYQLQFRISIVLTDQSGFVDSALGLLLLLEFVIVSKLILHFSSEPTAGFFFVDIGNLIIFIFASFMN